MSSTEPRRSRSPSPVRKSQPKAPKQLDMYKKSSSSTTALSSRDTTYDRHSGPAGRGSDYDRRERDYGDRFNDRRRDDRYSRDSRDSRDGGKYGGNSSRGDDRYSSSRRDDRNGGRDRYRDNYRGDSRDEHGDRSAGPSSSSNLSGPPVSKESLSAPGGGPPPRPAAPTPTMMMGGAMIEVIANDRLGRKVRVKCSPQDTVGDLKKLIAAQSGTTAKKIQLKKWYNIFKDHITLADYEIHDGMSLEMY